MTVTKRDDGYIAFVYNIQSGTQKVNTVCKIQYLQTY